MLVYRKITIIQSRKPSKQNLNDKLQWLASSLGLLNLRDKENTCFRIFIELIKNAKTDIELTSDELAYRLNLTRGTIVHHLNKLIEAGLVVERKNRYYLRVNNLKQLIGEVENDVHRTLMDLRNMASEIDEHLGL
ncbi:MAG: helix-turn-helix domain-containing protein [Candidatus Woesearchaeota archaeon]